MIEKRVDPEQREAVRHGEYIFPIQKYESVIDSNHPLITAHWHEELELTLIREGKCTYRINAEEIMAEKGDMLFLSPMLLHSAAREGEEVMQSDSFVFHLNLLGGHSADICSMKYLTPLFSGKLLLPYVLKQDHPVYAAVREKFMELEEMYHCQKEGYELMVKALLMQILFVMMQNRGSDQQSNGVLGANGIEKIKRVLAYIECHYEEPLTVGELADLCYFSEYHFMRYFKQCVGMTCVEYINNLRMEKAVELFEQGKKSVLEVSLQVGFHNLSYFHRTFRKKYHTTPKMFMQSILH